jgi:hypothetical protein
MGGWVLAWKSMPMRKLFTILLLGILSIAAFATTESVSGTWQVVVNGKASRGAKLIFTPQGGFQIRRLGLFVMRHV